MKKIMNLTFLIIFISSCIDRNDYIRDVYVNIEVPLNQPEYSDLDAIGNSIFISGGVRGIIIYHLNVNDYRAFDRNCTFEPSNAILILLTYYPSCSCCESKYLIDQDGLTANGPALLPLKHYTIFFRILKITN